MLTYLEPGLGPVAAVAALAEEEEVVVVAAVAAVSLPGPMFWF
jgi:hypothetical protein